jgi:hypothetical protein
VAPSKAPPIEDRILYWPGLLAAFWIWCFTSPPVEYSEGDLVPGRPLILALPLWSVAIAVVLCVLWLSLGLWRRMLCTLILPVTVFVLIYFGYL